jgi:hypothetical protein
MKFFISCGCEGSHRPGCANASLEGSSLGTLIGPGDPLPHIGTKSGREETITWRGSVSDLATDLVCALTNSQIDRLVDYLSDGVFVAKKRERSGG